MPDKPEVGRTYFIPLQAPIRPIEVAWLFNLSQSVITDALNKGKDKGGLARNCLNDEKYLWVHEAVEWRLRRVCPHLFKPWPRPIDINDYSSIPPANDYRPPKRSAPRGAVVTWWRCARQNCPGRGGEFPMAPSAKPSFCPFCGKDSALKRVQSNVT
jgi:hypothetical protein